MLEQSRQLFEELVAADPEDRENQVWLVHTLYHYGRLERNEGHYDRAGEVFRDALDRLRQAGPQRANWKADPHSRFVM